MPKPALKSETIRNSLYTTVLGLGMSAFSFLALPDNMDKINATAKLWGLEKQAKLVLGVGGLAFSMFGVKSMRGRHKIEGDEAIYTPDWLPIGRNLSDLGKTVGIGDIFQAVNETKQIAQAKTGEEKFNELVDAVTKLNQQVNTRLDKIELSRPIFDNQDIAHLPGPTPETQHVNRGQNFREPPRNRFEPPKEDREPAQQVELSGVPFDVTQSSDGVLEGY